MAEWRSKLHPRPRSSVDLELWALEKEKELFPRSFWARTFRCGGVESAQDFWRQAPVQDSGVTPEFHPGHGPFFQIHDRLAAVFADAASSKFAQVWVVPYHHDGFMFRKSPQQTAKIGKTGPRPQAIMKYGSFLRSPFHC